MEEKPNIIVDKIVNFSKKIINLYMELKNEKHYELASQLFRSGTSIGANVEEAQAAQSKKDFIAKMSISAKEARETRYWLRLIDETNISQKNIAAFFIDINEIISILTKIIKTSII
ncbi:MAG TPA: four helix bundle protein [Bacteroidia bacterium]|nr:four helix bundle protein [Bacteroidia bacterium]